MKPCHSTCKLARTFWWFDFLFFYQCAMFMCPLSSVRLLKYFIEESGTPDPREVGRSRGTITSFIQKKKTFLHTTISNTRSTQIYFFYLTYTWPVTTVWLRWCTRGDNLEQCQCLMRPLFLTLWQQQICSIQFYFLAGRNRCLQKLLANVRIRRHAK
jgi:hypothetical protein